MRRREFIAGLGGAAAVSHVCWPLSAHAQQRALPAIGFLSPGAMSSASGLIAAFRRGLSEVGYVEGKNVEIEFRYADGQYDQLPALAAELIRRRVSVLVASGAAAVPAAKTAAGSTPVVFSAGIDPVATGIVASLSRPGGNITGVSNLSIELGPKRLELLREAVPTTTSIAFLVNPTDASTESQANDMLAAARILGLQLHVVSASTEGDFDKAFAAASQLRVAGLVISNDAFLTIKSAQLAAEAMRHKLPAIFHFREFAEAGGLMSYGASNPDSFYIAGEYAGRILKGEKPADLPVQKSTKVELIINLKTAKALGLTFPITLLGRANEVIE
jgi:putative tryptophan/tyrosine transport system substrate-binding protein